MAADDLAVLGSDPRFGGGGRALTEAFWRAAGDLGRSPRLYSLAYRGLADGDPGNVLEGEQVRGALPGLDGVNQLVAGVRLAPRVRGARSLWVVSPIASHGYAAARSRRRYGVWVATTLESEWAARRAGVDRAQRIAHAASARTLRRLERETLRRAAGVYATSGASRAWIAAAADRAEHEVSVLSVPVNLETFAPLPDEVWLACLERPTIVFVGRGDDPRKNVGLLLQAAPLLRARIPDVRVLLVGLPPHEPLPDGVEALGMVPELPPLLRGCALFVLPSLQEGFGIAAAEALACGVPVLTTPSGGPEDLVRSSGGGRVLDGFDAEELAAGAAELLGDTTALTAMRTAGLEYVAREHSPDRFRTELAAAFANIDAARG